MTNQSFRDANAGDAKDIVEFQLAMAMATEGIRLDRAVCSAGVAAVFADPAKGRYFVADLDGQIVASLMITYEWSDWRNGHVWWIQSVYVVPVNRCGGIFGGLYRHVQELARQDSNVRGLRLYVDKRNIRAQEVYVRLGMNGEHYQLFEWMKRKELKVED